MNCREGSASEVAGERGVEDCASSQHEELVTRRTDKAMFIAFICNPCFGNRLERCTRGFISRSRAKNGSIWFAALNGRSTLNQTPGKNALRRRALILSHQHLLVVMTFLGLKNGVKSGAALSVSVLMNAAGFVYPVHPQSAKGFRHDRWA